MDFGNFIFSAAVTIFAYLLVPVIVSFAYKGILSRKKILIITIANGLVIWLLFRIVFALLNDNLPASLWSMAPACLWSIVAYFILQFRKGHLAEIISIKRELDETVSPNSTPFYIDFIKELKKELPNLSEIIHWDMPQKECAYQIAHDFAKSKLELYTKLNQGQNLYQAQMQQYAKVVSETEDSLQSLKTQKSASPDEQETVQTERKEAKREACTPAPACNVRHEATQPAFGTPHTQSAPSHPFANAMEALVELGLAKCQYDNEAFQLVYQRVKQQLQEDMADTEAQIRHSGKTPKEYVYQMIVDEIDHLKQVGV